MIEARELTRRYGDTTAVHSLSFTIAPELGCANGKVGSGSGLMCPPPASVTVAAPTQSSQGAL